MITLLYSYYITNIYTNHNMKIFHHTLVGYTYDILHIFWILRGTVNTDVKKHSYFKEKGGANQMIFLFLLVLLPLFTELSRYSILSLCPPSARALLNSRRSSVIQCTINFIFWCVPGICFPLGESEAV